MIDQIHKLHVAFIVDGNGRWALQQKRSRTFGHRKGIKVIQDLINKIKNNEEIGYVSFFVLSLENWKRSSREISLILSYLDNYLDTNINDLPKDIRFYWTGFKDNLPQEIVRKLEQLVDKTANNKGLVVNMVFNYGGIQDILQAANKFKETRQDLTYENFKNNLLTTFLPEVDLLIRTSGEKRISNYLLFLSAYAEFIFEPTYWPDYTYEKFLENFKEYKNRDIRKGGYGKNNK